MRYHQGRDLQKYVHKKTRVHLQLERANLFERYIPEVANALSRLTGKQETKIADGLKVMIKKDAIQEKIQTMQVANTEYDEEFANMGKGESDDDEHLEPNGDDSLLSQELKKRSKEENAKPNNKVKKEEKKK